MRLSRRLFGSGLLALLSVGFPRAGAAGPGLPSAARFAADLAARLVSNPSGAVFSVTAFVCEARASGGVEISAEVRLDWEPGFRVTRFAATAPGAEAAYEVLCTEAEGAFAGVVPGFAAQESTA